MINVRVAKEEDAEALLAIYAHYVKNTAITFEYEVPSVEEFRERIRETLVNYPYLVAEEDGKMIGYVYAGRFRPRAAFQWAAETSVYIDEKHCGKGLGKLFYAELEEILQRQHVTNVYAVVAVPLNEDDEYLNRNSERFHEAMGYETVGRYHGCGSKFGKWYSLAIMEKLLTAHECPPKKFIPFSELEEQIAKELGESAARREKKPEVVYHGSQYLFDVVKPMQAHGQCDAEAQMGIYAAATLEEVIPFAMPFRWYPDSPEGKLKFDSDGIRSFLQYGSIDPNGKGYVYVLPADTFELVDQWEWVSKAPVKPIKIIEVSVKDYWNTITFSEEAREIHKKLYGDDPMISGYVRDVLKYVKEQCEEFKEGAEDHYDFWEEHIGLVYEESIRLAKEFHADQEIVELGALLHDIAPIIKVGTRADHHESGARIAREMLTSLGYDPERTERVVKCVLHHRSSKNAETIEELCVADADILAHFDNLHMIFNSIFRRYKVKLSDAITLSLPTLDKDFNDLSDRTKPVFQPRYQEIYDYVKELFSIELKLWNAAKDRDVKAFKELVPDTAVMVCGGNRLSGEEYARIIADFDCKSYDIENFEILYSNENYAQFHYEIVIEVNDERNSDLAGRFHVTSTWNRQDGKWKLIFIMDQRI